MPQSFVLSHSDDNKDLGGTTMYFWEMDMESLVGYVSRNDQTTFPRWVFDNIVENLKKWEKVLYFEKLTNEVHL